MNSEKILVVYYSRTGNTRVLANDISRELHCDIEEISTTASYSGFWGIQRAFFHALFKRNPIIKRLNKNIDEYDLVIIGSPVWFNNIPGPIRSFLERYQNDFNSVAFFLSQQNSSSSKHSFESMRKSCKKIPVAEFSVSLSELRSGNYKEKVSSFINELNLSMPKTEKRRAKAHIKPETTLNP